MVICHWNGKDHIRNAHLTPTHMLNIQIEINRIDSGPDSRQRRRLEWDSIQYPILSVATKLTLFYWDYLRNGQQRVCPMSDWKTESIRLDVGNVSSVFYRERRWNWKMEKKKLHKKVLRVTVFMSGCPTQLCELNNAIIIICCAAPYRVRSLNRRASLLLRPPRCPITMFIIYSGNECLVLSCCSLCIARCLCVWESEWLERVRATRKPKSVHRINDCTWETVWN